MRIINRNQQSRKWIITINNPKKHRYTHDSIKEKLKQITSIRYYCMSDEKGVNGTLHTHIYIACFSAVRFSTIKELFWEARIEAAKGTSQQNRDYIFKEGKWESDEKAKTNLRDTHEEGGKMPDERPGKRNDMQHIYESIKQGKSNFDILEENSKYFTLLSKFEPVRQTLREEEQKGVFRELEITYVYGGTGLGKTRGVFDYYGYEHVRVSMISEKLESKVGNDLYRRAKS